MKVGEAESYVYTGLTLVGAGFALTHYLTESPPTLRGSSASLAGRAIGPIKNNLGQLQPVQIRYPIIPGFGPRKIPLQPGEIFPANLAEGCTPDPRTFLKEVEEHMEAGKPLARLYLLDTPEGPVRLGVVICYEGQTRVGFMTMTRGIGLLMDGPARDVKDAFAQSLRLLGEKYGLRLRATISAGVPGGCGPINQAVWS